MNEEDLYIVPQWFKHLVCLLIELKMGKTTMSLEVFQYFQPLVNKVSMNDFPRYKPFCERLWSPKKEVIEFCIKVAKLVFRKIEDNKLLLNGNWEELIYECEKEAEKVAYGKESIDPHSQQAMVR